MTDMDIDMLEGQIDIEDAIASLPPRIIDAANQAMTVSEYVAATGWPEWRVRKAILDEHLSADRTVRPMVITGGDMPLTVNEWHRALDGELRKVSPSRWSFSEGGRQLNILPRDNHIRIYKLPVTKATADDQVREIKRMDIQRKTDASQ